MSRHELLSAGLIQESPTTNLIATALMLGVLIGGACLIWLSDRERSGEHTDISGVGEPTDETR